MPEAQVTHEQAMAAKVDEVATQVALSTPAPVGTVPGEAAKPAPAAAPVRPENVPEKFWDAEKGSVNTEALLKSYVELEKGKAPGAPGAGEQTPPAAEQAAAAQAAVDAAKLDMPTLQQEFATTGKLTEESYKALEKAGFSKELVNTHIAGVVALQEAHDNAGYNLVGGKEAYSKMATWAQINLQAADLAAFDASVTGTPAQRDQAITALKARYEASMGSEVSLLGGSSNAGTGGETAFQSRAEVTAAMRDSRYQNDPAYRALVERRIGLMDTF